VPQARLHFRPSFYFAVLGVLVSLLFATAAYSTLRSSGQQFLLETLHNETNQFIARFRLDSHTPLPDTASIKGYLGTADAGPDWAPPALSQLSPGPHQIELNDTTYLALITDQPGLRLAFTIDEGPLLTREHRLLYGLGAAMLLLTISISLAGRWLTRRAVEPIMDLAARIAANESGNSRSLKRPSLDDIGGLILVFERHLQRIQSCVERERAFASDVSHELRNPLAVIRGAVEVLEDDKDLSAAQRNRIARIERASHDMTELTSALLRLSRDENGLASNADNCSMASIIRESVDRHRTLKGALTVNIELNIVDAPLLPVEKGLATVVVDNLIGNAMLHAQTSQILVCLERTRLIINDTGIGIEKSELDQIFHRHHRGPNSQGSGIGLSLVKRICDLHGWDIAIESIPGQGTTAQLTFGKKYPG
jgi:signal transduction histidine kinase